jgi:hypothetical protein
VDIFSTSGSLMEEDALTLLDSSCTLNTTNMPCPPPQTRDDDDDVLLCTPPNLIRQENEVYAPTKLRQSTHNMSNNNAQKKLQFDDESKQF